MGSLSNQKPWVPYMSNKDCSQGSCSLYCPQWCNFIFSPPPPFEFPDDTSGPNFSPIVIAIIGILGSAVLLLSYYAIISKYCKSRDSSRRREIHFPVIESDENQDPSNHEPWHVSPKGLDEALIKSITVFKYKKGDDLIEGTDCSVCLGEFQDDESLRLLPECSHAFHVMCIDTWLKSHSNCPLCRANIAFVNAPPTPQLPPVIESPPQNESSLHDSSEIENLASQEDIEMGIREAEPQNIISKHSSRQASDLGTSRDHSSMSGIRIDEGEQIRRSVSMDGISQGRLSIADVLRIDEDEEDQIMEHSRSTNRNRVLHCVLSPATVKRSFSSGRLLFSKGGRGRNIVIPL